MMAIEKQTRSRSAPAYQAVTGINRTARIYSAWGTSFTSKIATLLVQLVSIPAAYRSLGTGAFAAYAAVTSAVSILGFFSLGMDGAMVSPLAHASAAHDIDREREVVAATVLPLFGLASLVGLIALPALAVLPLPTLFGEASKAVSAPMLRTAVLVACAGTLVGVPMSAVSNARQAYQELHVSYAIATVTNTVMFLGILLVAWFSPTLISFVAVRVLVPVLGQVADAVLLLCKRPYLLQVPGFLSVVRVKATARDGLYFLAATSSNPLLYQWSIYLMTRMRPPAESAGFAVCIQVVLLSLSFFFGLVQPLWGATADACAAGDRAWLKVAIARMRVAALLYGLASAMGFGLLLNFAVSLWLRRPLTFNGTERWLAGLYVLLAGWEYGHWTLSLGQSRMRPASRAILARAASFAVVAPFAVRFGPQGMLCALCASIFCCTSWYCPQLVSRELEAHV
jgi:O-antigen/teichoic acid export membrane protein